MGANQTCCSVRQRQHTQGMDKREVFALREVLKTNSDESGYLDQETFDRLFPEPPGLGQQVYEFFKVELQTQPIPLEGCMNVVQEILGGDQLNLLLEISIGDSQMITQAQGFQFIGLLVQIYLQFSIRKAQIESGPMEIVVNSIFNEQQIKTSQFLASIEALFPHSSKLIKFYFQNRLLSKPFNLMRVPKLTKDSFVLKYEWLALMGLSSLDLHSHGQLTLIYQNALQAIQFQDIAQCITQNHTLLALTFADDNNRKYMFVLFSRNGWKQDGKDYNWSDGMIGFQILPTFQIFRPKQGFSNRFTPQSLGFAKDPKTDRYILYMEQNFNYYQQSSRLLTAEIWKCEELQSKLRKTVTNDEDRQSYTSPRTETQQQKKRVSFRLQEEPRKSASVQKYDQIVEPSSPQSPHFRTDQNVNQPIFTNPKQIIGNKQDYQQGQIRPSQQIRASQSQNRASQSIIEKYSTRPSKNQNQDNKSIDDILKRYDKRN